MKIGQTTEELAEITRLCREVTDLQRPTGILKAVTIIVAQELDLRHR